MNFVKILTLFCVVFCLKSNGMLSHLSSTKCVFGNMYNPGVVRSLLTVTKQNCDDYDQLNMKFSRSLSLFQSLHKKNSNLDKIINTSIDVGLNLVKVAFAACISVPIIAFELGWQPCSCYMQRTSTETQKNEEDNLELTPR